jgi:hypothetical protein
VAGHIFNYLIQNAFGLSFVVYFEGRIWSTFSMCCFSSKSVVFS